MLKKVGTVLGLVLVALLAFIATRPADYRVERSAQIAASAALVFPLVNDFHRWEKWSPWEKLDPNMKKTFSGAEAGIGAGYGWAGNDQVGEGRMTILESQAGERVAIKLEFLKPWTATNATTFSFKPDGAGTRVTWAMEGHNNFVAKAFSLFMDMDAMIGKDFEKGLASMKDQAEAQARQEAAK